MVIMTIKEEWNTVMKENGQLCVLWWCIAARMICEHLGYIECMLSLKDKINIYIQFMHQCWIYRFKYCWRMLFEIFIWLSDVLTLLINHAGRVIGDERFGRLDATSKFQSLSCFSSDHDLSDCSIQTSCTPTNCSTQYGIICKSKSIQNLKFMKSFSPYKSSVQRS